MLSYKSCFYSICVMKVLYIAAECKPFSKAGGVGDVAGELPVELKKQGVDVEIITPWYSKIDPEYRSKEAGCSFDLKFNGKDEKVKVYSGDLKGVPVNFLANEDYSRAEVAFLESLDVKRKTFPENHWQIATTKSLLGNCYSKSGQYVKAEELLKVYGLTSKNIISSVKRIIKRK